MLLQNKSAIIYGAAGSLGSTVAEKFAREGARVYLAGRTLDTLQKVADRIRLTGGHAEIEKVDALRESDVNAFVENVVKKEGKLDISICLIDFKDVQDIRLIDMNTEDFLRPVNIAIRSQFLTSTAAGRAMAKHGGGTILSLTATPGGIGYPMTGGFAIACAAMEAFVRNLGSELGAYNVRTVNLRSAGSPDSNVFKEAIEKFPDVLKPVLDSMKSDTMLKRLPEMVDIANTAAFLASDLARSITGVTIDVTCGTTSALNYKAPQKQNS